MARERKKPEGSFIGRAKNEIENEDTLMTNRAYRLGKIRGAMERKEIDDAENGKALLYAIDKTAKRVKKETIEKACEWLHSIIGDGFVRYGIERKVADNDQFEAMFRKAMEE